MIDCKKLWRIGINRHSVLYPIPQHPSPHQYIHTSPQRTTKLRGRRGGARGGEMAFATMNASPPRNCRMQNTPAGRRYTCRMRNAPAGRRYTCRMRNAPAGRRYICRMQNTPAGKGIHRMWKCSIPEGNPPHAKCSTLGRDSLPANFMLK